MSDGPIIGIGLPRTGTSSLREAMRILGYRVQGDPYNARRMRRLADGDLAGAIRHDTAQRYTYLSEPYYGWAPQVVAAGWRAIITTRELGPWKASLTAYTRRKPRGVRPEWLRPRTSAQRILRSMAFGGRPPIVSPTAAWSSHLALAWRCLRDCPEQVLVLDVCGGEGWEPLCEWLGVPVPDVLFPWRNARRVCDAA